MTLPSWYPHLEPKDIRQAWLLSVSTLYTILYDILCELNLQYFQVFQYFLIQIYTLLSVYEFCFLFFQGAEIG